MQTSTLIDLISILPIGTIVKKGAYGWSVSNPHYPYSKVVDEPDFRTALEYFIESYKQERGKKRKNESS